MSHFLSVACNDLFQLMKNDGSKHTIYVRDTAVHEHHPICKATAPPCRASQQHPMHFSKAMERSQRCNAQDAEP